MEALLPEVSLEAAALARQQLDLVSVEQDSQPEDIPEVVQEH